MSKTFEDCPRCGEKLKLHKRWYCDCGTYIIGLEHHDQEIKQAMLDDIEVDLLTWDAGFSCCINGVNRLLEELKQKYGVK